MRRILTVTLWIALAICPSLLFAQPLFDDVTVYGKNTVIKDYPIPTSAGNISFWFNRFRADNVYANHSADTDSVGIRGYALLGCVVSQNPFLATFDHADSVFLFDSVSVTSGKASPDYLFFTNQSKRITLYQSLPAIRFYSDSNKTNTSYKLLYPEFNAIRIVLVGSAQNRVKYGSRIQYGFTVCPGQPGREK